MTYKGNQVYRTVPGGVVSLLAKLAILLYFAILIPQVTERKKDVTLNTTKIDLSNDTNPLFLTEDNFDLAVRITKLGSPLSQDMLLNRAKYFKIDLSLSSFKITVVGNTTVNKPEVIPIELGKCTTDRLGNLTDQTSSLKLDGGDWVCPLKVNFSIRGQPSAITRSSLKLRVVPCNKAKISLVPDDNITCASDEDISTAIQQHFFQVVILKSYFDENEFDKSPVKKELHSGLYNIQENTAYFKGLQFQKAKIKTRDHWLSGALGNQDYDYQNLLDISSSIAGYPKPNYHDMFTMIFSRYDYELTYTRTVVSLTDIISKTGGLSSFILFISLTICKSFQFSLYEKSLTKKLFKVRANAFTRQLSKEAEDYEEQNKINLENQQNSIDEIMSKVQQWRPFKFNFLKAKFLSFIVCCRRKTPINNRSTLFLQQIEQELFDKIDIVKILQRMHQFNEMKKLLLKDHQLQIVNQLYYFIDPTQHHNSDQRVKTPSENEQMSQSFKKLIRKSARKSIRDQKLLSFITGEQSPDTKTRRKENRNVFDSNQKLKEINNNDVADRVIHISKNGKKQDKERMNRDTKNKKKISREITDSTRRLDMEYQDN